MYNIILHFITWDKSNMNEISKECPEILKDK